MASAFSHIAVPALLFASFKSDSVNFKLFLLAAICSVIPDVDVVTFKFGIPYESQWGHRGFTPDIPHPHFRKNDINYALQLIFTKHIEPRNALHQLQFGSSRIDCGHG